MANYGASSFVATGSDGGICSSHVKLAKLLAGILANNLGHRKESLEDICDLSTCFLRLNRYPACPISPEMFGLVPHTDSDFLTILCQDQVGGLQLMKDSKWVAVKPNPEALIVNIGDLFQAWSNDVYKSVEHKVMANEKMERYSIAYFMCPSYDSLIGSCSSSAAAAHLRNLLPSIESSLFENTGTKFNRMFRNLVTKLASKISSSISFLYLAFLLILKGSKPNSQ
ncbi:gibberellin 2-beta-dioxygenase 8 [Prunus yedoensis var. nudiflora]|uniref:Gibberellin 2-beta-dioxygenase 8 n=1 Tax=Prunus yedoensis var. nudiflora TaxID=2094558 RepID=A0A314U605_PRUYE|nr:gibberellin 2-beta-dioxygenase 8 [Prunus yedoensis var. nudiflora]